MIIHEDCRKRCDLAQHLSARHQATGRGPHRCEGKFAPSWLVTTAPTPTPSTATSIAATANTLARRRRTIRRCASLPRNLSITRVSNPKGGSASGASHNIVSATSASDSDSALQCAHVSRWSRTRDRLRPERVPRANSIRSSLSASHSFDLSGRGSRDLHHGRGFAKLGQSQSNSTFRRTERYGLECRDLGDGSAVHHARTIARR